MFLRLLSLVILLKTNVNAFRVVLLPGFGNDQIDYTKFVSNLSNCGVSCKVVPINRPEWLNIARGVFSPRFWRNQCLPDELFEFYYSKVDDIIRDEVKQHGEPVVLLCHSAGGWLARGLLRNNDWRGSGTAATDLVAGIVTLGSPHLPPPVGMDMTRGALRHVDEQYPGAYLRDKLFYLTVAGAAVRGDAAAEDGTREKIAHNSYTQVIGDKEAAMTIGDGIVPVSYAHLEGARQLTLEGVFHSINAPGDYWYGGEDVLPQWLPTARVMLQSQRIQRRLDKYRRQLAAFGK